MNSLRDEAAKSSSAVQSHGRSVRFFLAAVVVVAVLAAALFAWLQKPASPDSDLAEAREHLFVILETPGADARKQHAPQAAQLLRRYLAAGGTERDSAVLLLACAACFQDEWESAPRLLNEVNPANVGTKELAITALSLVELEQFQPADQLITEALKRGDEREAVLRVAINVRYQVDRLEDVLDHCRELTELAGDDPYPWIVLAALYENQGDQDLMIDAYRRLVDLDTGNAEFQHRLVSLLISVGDAEEARRHFDRLTPSTPRLVEALPLTRAQLLYLEGRVDEALARIDELLDQMPDASDALLLKGQILLGKGQSDAAKRLLVTVVQSDPDHSQAHYLLSQAYALSGSRDMAEYHRAMHGRLLSQAKARTLDQSRRRARPIADADSQDDVESFADIVQTGDSRMRRLLAEIRSRINDENEYLGDGETKRLRRLAAAPPPDMPKSESLQVGVLLARSEMRLGNEQEAIDELLIHYKNLQATGDIAMRQRLGPLTFQLGVAYMRLAETQNCCRRFTAESCLFPIRGSGIHTETAPARNAIRYFTEVLQSTPPDSALHLQSRWLLNIAYMTIGEYPTGIPADYVIPPAVFQSEEHFPRFTNVSRETGVATFNTSGGAIADDFDNDGDLDLVTGPWHPQGRLRYFQNNGTGSFSDRSLECGFEGLSGGLNLVQADYNNDGWMDVLVLRGAWLGQAGVHPNSLLRNQGDGTFEDVTFAAGLGAVHYPTQTAAWADYDNDGDLDLYIGNETHGGKASPCQLFQNNGDGTFHDVATAADVTNDSFTKGVVWGDYDADGHVDLFVSNQWETNRLYRNNGDGTFDDVAGSAGVKQPSGSFGAWFWDYDNDGTLDLYVCAYTAGLHDLAAHYLGLPFEAEVGRLYRGDGRGGFRDVTVQQGLARPTATMGSNFGDLDNDGFLDFYLGTGYPEYEMLMPCVMFHNRRGERFSDVTTAGGFGSLQ